LLYDISALSLSFFYAVQYHPSFQRHYGYERIQSGIDQSLMIDEEDLENYNIHNIVPEVQHAEAIDLAEIPSVVEALGCFIPESTCAFPVGAHSKTFLKVRIFTCLAVKVFYEGLIQRLQ
jgi:hypothetical protein